MDLIQHPETLYVEPIIDYKLKRMYNHNDERSEIDIDIKKSFYLVLYFILYTKIL